MGIELGGFRLAKRPTGGRGPRGVTDMLPDRDADMAAGERRMRIRYDGHSDELQECSELLWRSNGRQVNRWWKTPGRVAGLVLLVKMRSKGVMSRMEGSVEYEDEGATDLLPTKRCSAVLACNGLQWLGSQSRDTSLNARVWDRKKR
jgi:hypothetical protein